MPLLLLDLDNTLVDRAGAFRAWAASYLAERGDSPDLLEEMVVADGDGLHHKPGVAAAITSLLGLGQDEQDAIIATLRAGVVEHLTLVPDAEAALAAARGAGWTPFIVTNGVVAQQEAKIHTLGLDRLVDGWVVSEGVGFTKPDPRIFTVAAERAGQSLDGAWMVGDSAEADIAGAHAAGIASVYLSRGRSWTASVAEPTAFADSLGEAVRVALASR